MTESSGICHYLGTRHGPTPLIVGVDEPAYGTFLNWMYFSDATLTFPQTLVLRYSQLEPEERRNPQVATDYAKWFLGRLRAVEAATGKAETLCAGRFTTADIVIGYALRLAENVGLAKDFGPNVAAYWARLQLRDATRAVAASSPANREDPPVLKHPPTSAGSLHFRYYPSVTTGAMLYSADSSVQSAGGEADLAPGGTHMNDRDRRRSGHLMLISPERVF
jgi:glutathione S-transferase